MRAIESCEFNMDTACIEIIYTGDNMLYLYIPTIEDSLRTTVYSRSKLDLMLDNEPFEYTRMILDGTMQDYLDRVDDIGQSHLKSHVEQLLERYPKNIAEDIAREFVMYE